MKYHQRKEHSTRLEYIQEIEFVISHGQYDRLNSWIMRNCTLIYKFFASESPPNNYHKFIYSHNGDLITLVETFNPHTNKFESATITRESIDATITTNDTMRSYCVPTINVSRIIVRVDFTI